MFAIIAAVVAVGTVLFVFYIGYEARVRDWGWISEPSRAMYVDVVKTLITASGVAVAIVVSALGGKFVAPMWMVQRAVVCLILCIILSVITILFLTRGYERARSRNAGAQEGRLSGVELYAILISGALALVAFMLGFLYLARIAFYIT